jgi:hypothetical protein
MGNKNSCCARSSQPPGRKDLPHFDEYLPKEPESVGNLQHISEREPEDWDADPSLHPKAGTIFMERSRVSLESEYFFVTVLYDMTFSCSVLYDNFWKGLKPVELIAPFIFQMDW